MAAGGEGEDILPRDEALLESAVGAPQATMMGNPVFSDPIEVAAAYLFYLCRNHPFVDGNKRTGLAAADTFLYFNGLDMEAENEDLIQVVTLVAAGKIDEEGVAAFFSDHTRSIGGE